MGIFGLINLKGYTVGKFASAVGVSENRMIDIIHGGKADVSEFLNMAKALDMSCDDLYKCLRPFRTTREYLQAAEVLGVTVDNLIEAEKAGNIINISDRINSK